MGRQVTPLLGQYVRNFLFLTACTLIAACSSPQESRAAPYAAFVMDARTGETLYSENATTRLHPASLTKMMTLYIAFEEIERGNLSLDTMITVTKNAAAQPPSRLGLKAGQKIQLRYLIRAAAVKSANDAAQAIGDHIGGNQEKFAVRMTRTAKAIGMKNTTFKNANGLTAKGHLSTAQDMSVLGRHLFYDFPQYYNIFSRRTTDAGMAEVANTNRRFLDAYKGADGIKTGYTEPAGFNLTASAERGNVRIIATVFGGKSTADRNAKVSDLLDLGFRKAPGNANESPPATPQYQNADDELIASGDEVDALPEVEGGSAKTLRVVMTLKTSPRPVLRPDDSDAVQTADATEEAVAAMSDGIAGALAEATGEELVPESLEVQAVELAEGSVQALGVETLSAQPAEALAAVEPETPVLSITAAPANTRAVKLISTPRPPKRKAPIYDEVLVAEAEQASDAAEVVTRVSTSGNKHWGINVGRFNSHGEAERVLLKTQLVESATLATSLRKVVQKSGGYDANFLGLGQEEADLACRRLQARGVQCFTMGP
jgi:D-alanyl-D-alanine carboxypeptidase